MSLRPVFTDRGLFQKYSFWFKLTAFKPEYLYFVFLFVDPLCETGNSSPRCLCLTTGFAFNCQPCFGNVVFKCVFILLKSMPLGLSILLGYSVSLTQISSYPLCQVFSSQVRVLHHSVYTYSTVYIWTDLF